MITNDLEASMSNYNQKTLDMKWVALAAVGGLALLVTVTGLAMYAGAETLLQHKTYIPINGIQTEVFDHVDHFPFKLAAIPIAVGGLGIIGLGIYLFKKKEDLHFSAKQKVAMIGVLIISAFGIAYGATLLSIQSNAVHMGAWPRSYGGKVIFWEYHKFIQPEKVVPLAECGVNMALVGSSLLLFAFHLYFLAKRVRVEEDHFPNASSRELEMQPLPLHF